MSVRKSRERAVAAWTAQIDWTAARTAERVEWVRAAYAAGVPCTAIARRAGVTKNVIVGLCYRMGLTTHNAGVWTPERGAAIVAARPPIEPYVRAPKPTPTRQQTAARRRVHMRNRGVDDATRAAVELLNAAPFHDWEIALEMGVAHSTLTKWRCGHNRGSPFLLSLVGEAVQRLRG